MSSLRHKEQEALEDLFQMASGYVLDFTDRTFGRFFQDYDIDIHSEKYCTLGTSKANKLRTFLEVEEDYFVGQVLDALIDIATDLDNTNEKIDLIKKCRTIVNRLSSGKMNLGHLEEHVNKLSSEYIHKQIRRMEQAIKDHDPCLAIGTAKELIETCCKTILKERNVKINANIDIPSLTKLTLKQLKLTPDNIHKQSKGNQVIKNILQNLGAILNGLAELRGLYGTGHGKDGKSIGLKVRHAKLAVGAASTLATFLFDTHEKDKS